MALANIDIRSKVSSKLPASAAEQKSSSSPAYSIMQLQLAWLINAVPELKQFAEEKFIITIPSVNEIMPYISSITSGFDKVKVIADKAFSDHCLLDEEDLIKSVMKVSGVDETRAAKGIELMYKAGYVSGIFTNKGASYYLSYNTPF